MNSRCRFICSYDREAAARRAAENRHRLLLISEEFRNREGIPRTLWEDSGTYNDIPYTDVYQEMKQGLIHKE